MDVTLTNLYLLQIVVGFLPDWVPMHQFSASALPDFSENLFKCKAESLRNVSWNLVLSIV